MQELKYQLVKEDYMDWIHWNVARHSNKKTKIITVGVFVAFLLFFVGSNVAAKKSPAEMMSSLIMILLLGAFMFYAISPAYQEKVIWKRSGLKKLEHTKGFPTILLSLKEKSVTMEAPGEIRKEYSYAELVDFEETPRLYLVGTVDRSWQFVAKSVFESPEKADEFKTFLQEKIADAKENPEKYEKEEPAEINESSGDYGEGENGSVPLEEENGDVVIKHVDTSGMGKIGKMANLIAAMAESEDDEAQTAQEEDVPVSAAQTAQEENVPVSAVQTAQEEDVPVSAVQPAQEENVPVSVQTVTEEKQI